MSEVAQIINTVGFPIVSFLIAAYFIKYTYDKTAEANKEAMDTIANLTEAVNNNTIVLTQLVQQINNLESQ